MFEAAAIDFQALLQQERAKARAEAAAAKSASSTSLIQPKQLIHLAENTVHPSGIFYVADFLTHDEASKLQTALLSAAGSAACSWQDLTNRRLCVLGGVPHASGMCEEALPSFAASLCRALNEAGIFSKDRPANHVLINEYTNGQGISAHKDGRLYDSCVAIVSLGAPAVLKFWSSNAAIAAATQDSTTDEVAAIECEHCRSVQSCSQLCT
jgi:2OG-Fe(II) oxygenase superfamily